MSFEFNDNQQAVASFYKKVVTMINGIYKSKNFRCRWATSDIYLYGDDLIKKGIIYGIWEDYI